MRLWWILDEHGKPVPADVRTAALWWSAVEDMRVCRDVVGEVEVSTVFTGINYAFFGGPPVLWETMVLGGARDGYQRRYTSEDDARRGHAEILAMVASSSPASSQPVSEQTTMYVVVFERDGRMYPCDHKHATPEEAHACVAEVGGDAIMEWVKGRIPQFADYWRRDESKLS